MLKVPRESDPPLHPIPHFRDVDGKEVIDIV